MLTHLIRLPAYWPDVIRRTLKEIRDDNCLGLAAQLAFYFLMALFPALLFLVALIGFLPVDYALAELLAALGAVAPRELIDLLVEQVERITKGNDAGLLTLGVIGALWTSSAGMVAIIDALNRAYGVTEWRPWWKRRLVAVALTVSLAIFIVVSFTFILIGPALAGRLASWFGLEPAVAFVWQLVRWPVIVASVALGTNLIYHFAPNRERAWRWITPGAALSTVLWIVASLLFKFYVANFGSYVVTYGAIGGAIVTMLWFYVSGLAILVGAELNGVLEERRQRLSP